MPTGSCCFTFHFKWLHFKALHCGCHPPTTKPLQWSLLESPSTYHQLPHHLRAIHCSSPCGSKAAKPVWCPSSCQDTTTSIIRAGNACGIAMVSTTNKFLPTAACENLLLTCPKNCFLYGPSCVARAVLFSQSFFLLCCLCCFFFSWFFLQLESVSGRPTFSSYSYGTHDWEAPGPGGHNGRILLCVSNVYPVCETEEQALIQ